MSTKMTERDRELALEALGACLPRRGAKGRDGRPFLEAWRRFAVHCVARRALPGRFGPRNGVWRRFSRLSRAGAFEAFPAMLAARSRTAGAARLLDSTMMRARVSAAGAEGGEAHGPGRSRGVRRAVLPPEGRLFRLTSARARPKADLDGHPIAFGITGGGKAAAPMFRGPAPPRPRWRAPRLGRRQGP